ncbi:MAG: hypothetical protein KAT11_04825 [Phycisphaerae bacterium]|nr:hypothetical protein [Phycisphaerae bacterium]
MHTAKLHAALHCIGEEFDCGQVVEKLGELQGALDTSVQSPSEQNTKAFQQACGELEKLLQSSPTNRATPSTRGIFERIGALGYTGQGLWGQVSGIIEANTMSPADAQKQMAGLGKKVMGFYKSVKAMHTKLHDFGIEHEPLAAGQACIGIGIPPELVGSNLDGLGTEIHEFDDALKTFQKIVGQEVVSLKISSLGPAGFQLFLQVSPELAAPVALAIERIAGVYENLMQIKKLRADLVEQKVPAERIETIAEHEGELVDKELGDLAQAILDEYLPASQKQRGGDLKIALEEDLRFLADRIDRGVVLEVEVAASESASEKEKESVRLTNARGRALAELERAPEPIFGLSKDEAK